MVLIAFGFGAFYWIMDSLLYIFLSYKLNLFQRLFGPDINDIWLRLIVICLFVIFGSHVQFVINKRKITEMEFLPMWLTL